MTDKAVKPASSQVMSAETLTSMIESLEFWGILGAILVAIGVAMEAVVAIKGFRLHRQLKVVQKEDEQKRELKIAETEKQAALLKLEVEKTRTIATAADLKADRLKPLRQPIKTVSGFLRIETGPTTESLGMTEQRRGLAEVMIRVGPNRPDKENAFDVVSKGKPTIFGNMTNGWDVYFECGEHPTFHGVHGPNPDLPLGEFLKNLNRFSMDTYFLPNKTQVKGGELRLTFNSAVTVILPIPPHIWGDKSTVGQYFTITPSVSIERSN